MSWSRKPRPDNTQIYEGGSSKRQQPHGPALPISPPGPLRAAFSDGWDVTGIEAATFDLNPGMPASTAHARLADIHRT